MCSLASDKVGETCRQRGYQGLFEGSTRTISAELFDITIKLNFWQRYSTDESLQLRLATGLFEVVRQRHEQLNSGVTTLQLSNDDRNEEWKHWMEL
jgi:hypothetical protein